ncbi:sigma-E processing peptidase SpoIIGA [Gracilibacillus salinarum]|uniref:Sporulation sigma-E factor-processing peptidase n=1 Tax=Gracilibacillus salinarum TaxID=2932255 RepID=A0ABY4GM91_9BACI|nr:sigma-E processing peptidase SpoIIGA [Gracilibacillus salinarum]UOQ85495.1 sigma-E processing peptidase SpoIIGA [Gracilibacillus salinarum]
MVTVYIEVIWLINIMIDWMILLLTQSITRHMTKWYRLLLASLFGSIIVPLSFIAPTFPIDAWYFKVMHSMLMVCVAFGFRNVAVYLKLLCTFYFMTFSIGGGLFAIHFLFYQEGNLTSQGVEAGQIHALFVLIGFPIVLFFTKLRMDKHKMQQFEQEFYYTVSIDWKQKIVETTGYLDSGNHLVDPFTQTPVIIVDETILRHWYTEAQIAQLRTSYQQLLGGESNEFQNEGFRLLPFQGVSGSQDFMLAFKPDLLNIHMKDLQLTSKKVLIGIQFGNLVSDDSYHCLLHPKLFQQTG